MKANSLYQNKYTCLSINITRYALFEKIVAKDKSTKLALIEVENKLIKQAFSIAKSGLKYDENYVRSNLLIHNLYFIGILPQFIVGQSLI